MTEDIRNEIFEQTLKRVWMIGFTDEKTTPYNSKIGGQPYWPMNEEDEYPYDMIFLAQVNFLEVPNNGSLPKHGILQFYVKDDEILGLDTTAQGKGLKYDGALVVYHKYVDATGDIEPLESPHSPIRKPGKMVFKPRMECISYSDYRFPATIDDSVFEDEEFDGSGSKLLGYPFFTQVDPREYYEAYQKYDTLLLQLDSDSEYMMWGDAGVANFFINCEKLRHGDFSDIFYTWDCC